MEAPKQPALQFHPQLLQSWQERRVSTVNSSGKSSLTALGTDAATPLLLSKVSNHGHPSKIIEIEPTGNLRLVVGAETEKIVFTVSRDIVYESCPTLLLDPGVLRKPNITEVRSFDHYDWDARPLEIILNIAHANFRSLPRSIAFRTAAQLSSLAESCKLEAILQPFMSGWFASLLPYALSFQDSFWLHVAWTFRLRDLFGSLVQYSVDHSVLSESHLTLGDDSRILDCLPEACDKTLYSLIDRTRSKRILELSTIIREFSNYTTWLERSACQRVEDTDEVQRYQCATLRYGLFQAALNKDFATLANQPDKVSESLSECVHSLLCIDHDKQDGPPIVVQDHPDCDCGAFKQAIIELFLPSNRQIKELDGLGHFNEQNDQGIVRLYGNEPFGSLLHPYVRLFDESDMPSASQLAHHGEYAQKQKIAKKCKQEDAVDNVQVVIVNTSMGTMPIQSRSSSGLFVADDREETNANPGNEAIPIDSEPAALIKDVDYLADDPNFDTDLYDLDEAWELSSTCSTEPDEEWIEDFDEIAAYRQLRGVNGDKLPGKNVKRKIAEIVDLTTASEAEAEVEAEAVDPPPKRRKKHRKESRRERARENEE